MCLMLHVCKSSRLLSAGRLQKSSALSTSILYVLESWLLLLFVGKFDTCMTLSWSSLVLSLKFFCKVIKSCLRSWMITLSKLQYSSWDVGGSTIVENMHRFRSTHIHACAVQIAAWKKMCYSQCDSNWSPAPLQALILDDICTLQAAVIEQTHLLSYPFLCVPAVSAGDLMTIAHTKCHYLQSSCSGATNFTVMQCMHLQSFSESTISFQNDAVHASLVIVRLLLR